jgi:hypothetical protein
MKSYGKIAACLVGGLTLNVGLRAAVSPDTSPLKNPYAPVVGRNVFGLNPPDPPSFTPAQKLPEITLMGIMIVCGHASALFKVSKTTAGTSQPDKEQYYNLSEGAEQGGIKVVRIDDKNGLVIFVNHGIEQEVHFAKAP